MTLPAMNPITKKELRVGARTVKFPVALMAYALVMTLISWLVMVLANNYLNMWMLGLQSTYVDYSTYAESFVVLAISQMCMICLIMPILTASSISSEREMQTLDVMLTTPVSTFSIMIGKLFSAMVKLLLFVVCSFPAMAVCFLYGGINWGYLLEFLIGIMVLGFFCGAIGIFWSTYCQKTIVAIILTLMTEFLFMCLPASALMMRVVLEYSHLEAIGAVSVMVGLGFEPLIMIFSPVFTFVSVMVGSTSGTDLIDLVCVSGFNDTYTVASGMAFFGEIWVPLSIAVTIAIGLLYLWRASVRLDSSRRKNEKMGKGRKAKKEENQ